MLRAYVSDWDGGDALPELNREEMHHLVRVRRVRAGEAIEVLNGRGHIGKATVASVDNRRAHIQLNSVEFVAESQFRIHLRVALPKGKTFPNLLQKAVELGVSAITPLETDHVEADPGRAGDKRERWESVLVEAVKQSGNPWLPVLHPTSSLDSVFDEAGDRQRVCAALQPDARPLWQLLGNPLQPKGQVDIFVGPEGDFSEREYTKLREAGCHFCSLGPLVLKVDTAACLVLGTLQVWARA